MEKDIIKLAVDLTKGQVANYSIKESNEVLRNALGSLVGFSKNASQKELRRNFRENKAQIFSILEEVINETLHEGLEGQFDGFADYRNLAWGDENLFKVPAKDIFRVALVSDGNQNLRRQRLKDGQEFKLSLDTYAVKVGEDLHRFLAGRVDWVDFMETIAKSFQIDLTQRVADAVYNSFNANASTYHKAFVGKAPTENELVEMAMHIEARTGEKVVIYGTKLALRKLAPNVTTDIMNNERNRTGYYGTISGIELREISQSHKIGTDEFAIDNNFVLLLPENPDKMIKVVNEGDAIIVDGQGTQNADMMQEYFIANKFGIGVITSKIYGFAKFSVSE